jgi:hypothetical protein
MFVCFIEGTTLLHRGCENILRPRVLNQLVFVVAHHETFSRCVSRLSKIFERTFSREDCHADAIAQVHISTLSAVISRARGCQGIKVASVDRCIGTPELLFQNFFCLVPCTNPPPQQNHTGFQMAVHENSWLACCQKPEHCSDSHPHGCMETEN